MSLVLSERYVIPLESHLGDVSGDSTISDDSDSSFSCPLERELIQKLGILSIPGTSIYVTYSMQILIHLNWSHSIPNFSSLPLFCLCVSFIQRVGWILFLHSIYSSKNPWPLQLRKHHHLQLWFFFQFLDKFSSLLSWISSFDGKTYSFSHIFLTFGSLVAFFAWQFFW